MAAEITIEHNPAPVKLEVMGVYDWPIWTKEVSTFPWSYDRQEKCYLLTGDVIVTPAGEVWVLQAAGLFDGESTVRLIRLGHPDALFEERLWTPDGRTEVEEGAEWDPPAEDWSLGISDDGSMLLFAGVERQSARKLHFVIGKTGDHLLGCFLFD